MMWNVTLCRQLIFEDAIEAESEEEAVEIAMEHKFELAQKWPHTDCLCGAGV